MAVQLSPRSYQQNEPDTIAEKKQVDQMDSVDGGEEGQATGGQETPKYIVGWRLHLITFGLAPLCIKVRCSQS